MSGVVISVERLGKKYSLGSGSAPYKTLRESLMDLLAVSIGPVSRRAQPPIGPAARGHSSEFWALRDISFDVDQGQVLGVIGRNGAGKSTLLKLASQITEPTEGRIRIQGRVASLLEVGTGFHPELTGRENVFLNGAILGMSRSEVSSKFDEIVAFAEVERFVDTPVKHYSSGMFLRLAFAVAAHLEPDILIVDEVLAVGDASFQKRCLNKMDDVRQTGRTVIFVSHDMSAITRLCKRAILLDYGRVVADGPAHQVVGTYLQTGLGSTGAREWPDIRRAPGNDVVRLRAVKAIRADGQTDDAIDIREPIGLVMEYDVMTADHVLVPNFHVFNEEGICVFVVHDTDPDWRRRSRLTGRYVSTVWIPANFLAEGRFTVSAAVSTHDPVIIHAHEPDAVAFHVTDTLDGDSARGDYAGYMHGVVRPLLTWTNLHKPTETETNSVRVTSV